MSSTPDDHVQFVDITKEQFAKYCEIQRSGKTNMLDTLRVAELSDYELDRETVRAIIKHYAALVGKFGAL